MHVLDTCKNKDDSIKNEGSRVVTTFPPTYKSRSFFQDAQGKLTPQPLVANFALVCDFMIVLVTCKTEEDPIKNEGARVFMTLYINLIFQTLKGR